MKTITFQTTNEIRIAVMIAIFTTANKEELVIQMEGWMKHGAF